MVRDKVVIVTGSSAGIGAATAIKFAEEGAAAVVLHGRNEETLKKVKEQTEAAGKGRVKTHVVIGDITDAEVRQRLIGETIGKFGQLDVLVNNAGIYEPSSPLSEAPIEQLDKLFNINTRSLISTTQLAVPHLIKTKGNIVNVSSVASTTFRPMDGYNGISKAAVDHFTKCLAAELGPKGVRVNAVTPALICGTECMTRLGLSLEEQQRIGRVFSASYPLRRLGKMEELANAIVYLASDKASFITGAIVPVDGGSLLTPFVAINLEEKIDSKLHNFTSG